ncbi:MAG: ABC transporter substrate-binding protein [Elusimicrobia bacterium]|nr:ABC transporter substrate-binding protein [Elusimicrobiota bacterium]
MKRSKILFAALAALLCTAVLWTGAQAADSASGKKTYAVAWSHYTGWEPWAYADESGILKKWADKYGIAIKLSLINDYVESINLYTSGKFDACLMTNMDALTIPAVGGVDSTALIVGDFSNGNDGIVVKKGKTVKDLEGQSLKLVQLSVSHYLLSRALFMNGMTEKQVKLVNTSDADIGSVFVADPAGAAVTWNPILMKTRNAKGAVLVFDSSSIPGEIMDLLVVKTNAPEELKKALTGAWYETMSVMSGKGMKNNEALAAMAKTAGGTVAEFKAQLKTTRMFYKGGEAADFAKSADMKKTMEYVRTFSFDHGLFGQGATSKDFVGIEFVDGSVLGDKKVVKLRFTDRYMRMASEGKL